MLIKEAKNFRDNVMKLLVSEKLPVADLSASLDNFIVIVDNDDELMGVAGLEIYGNCGLLRSVAVKPEYRNRGIANQLLQQLESQALSGNLNAIYLLTETASTYSVKKGYAKVERDNVPEEIQASSEFSHLCPSTAIVMEKKLI